MTKKVNSRKVQSHSSTSRGVSSRHRKRQPRRILGLRWHHFGGLSLALIGLVWLGFILEIQPSGKGSADSCTVSNILVNSCRPWLGAAVLNYTGAPGDSLGTNPIIQIQYHETRIGRQLDIVHTYHPQGSGATADSMTSADLTFAQRANTILFANWKPGAKNSTWAQIAAGQQDSNINTMAGDIKALGSTKIFLTLWHEPENDVTTDDSAGGSSCNATINSAGGYAGAAGTTSDYVAMWHHVQAVFSADGVNNVVWAVDFMNYSKWDCLIPALYPGDSAVDWVVFNAYQPSVGATFESTVKRFTDLLTSDSIGTGKPWGIVEWGASKFGSQTVVQATQDEENYYASAKTALDTDDSTIAKLKMYMIFDENDQGGSDSVGSCNFINERVGYDDDCNLDATKGNSYYAFADDPRFTNAFYAPPPDTTAPTVSLTSPSSGATVSGTITVTGTASDNVGVSSVSLYVDGAKVSTDSSSPYSFSLDTTGYSDATHSLQLKASDAANNVGSSASVSIIVKNQSSGGGSGSTGGSGNTGGSSGSTTTTTVTAGSLASSGSAPLAVKGTLVITGNDVQVAVDGKTQTGNSVNTSDLTNGKHTLTVVEDGKTIHKTIVVQNPWSTALKNEFQAHRVAYSGGAGVGMLVIGLGVWLFRRRISHWLLRLRPAHHLARFTTSQIIKPFGK